MNLEVVSQGLIAINGKIWGVIEGFGGGVAMDIPK